MPFGLFVYFCFSFLHLFAVFDVVSICVCLCVCVCYDGGMHFLVESSFIPFNLLPSCKWLTDRIYLNVHITDLRSVLFLLFLLLDGTEDTHTPNNFGKTNNMKHCGWTCTANVSKPVKWNIKWRKNEMWCSTSVGPHNTVIYLKHICF